MLLFAIEIRLTKENCKSSAVELVKSIATFDQITNFRMVCGWYTSATADLRIMKIGCSYSNKAFIENANGQHFHKRMYSSLYGRRMKTVCKRYHAANWKLN